MKKLLLIVDPQIDFISGSLSVGGADEAMKKLGEYIGQHDGEYVLKVVTTDWHPYHHCSFKDQGGPWPAHCVQNTIGAAISEHLVAPLNETKGDFCVLNTLKDGIALYGKEKFNVLTDFCPSLDGGKALSDYLKELGK